MSGVATALSDGHLPSLAVPVPRPRGQDTLSSIYCGQNHSQGEARTCVQMRRRSEVLGQIIQTTTRLTLREQSNTLLCVWKG